MDLSDFNDAELLELIADREYDPDVWKHASGEFYNRHITWFYGECKKRRYRIPGGDAEGFARDVFVSVIESKASSFSRRDDVQGDDVERCVRAWLGRIAENQMSDFYRESGGIVERSNVVRVFQAPTAAEEDARDGGSHIDVVGRMLIGLDDRDRAIVLEYLKWEEDGKRIPSEILQGMAEEFTMTSDGVRKVYYRFRQSVKVAIESGNPQLLVGQFT